MFKTGSVLDIVISDLKSLYMQIFYACCMCHLHVNVPTRKQGEAGKGCKREATLFISDDDFKAIQRCVLHGWDFSSW
jgi:hypothetical protein